MTLREVRSFSALGRPLPAKVAHRARPDVVVAQGNHDVSSPSLGARCKASGLTIFHFPYRSYAQFERKIANGGTAYARNTSIPPAVGEDWRRLNALLEVGGLRRWYEALPHADDPETSERIARGEVVDDRRLADYLRRNVLRSPIR